MSKTIAELTRGSIPDYEEHIETQQGNNSRRDYLGRLINGVKVRVVDTGSGAVATDYEAGDTIDGVTLAAGDLVLRATSGGNASDGVYIASASGAASRHAAFAAYDDHPGALFSVMEGTTNAGTIWQCTSARGGTIDSTALTVSQFVSGDVAGDIHAATGKSTPVDADELGIVDSAASNVLKKLTFANLWAWVLAKFAAATSVVLGGTGDLKLRVLKDASGDTASIVFEQGGNIIADIGLTGDNKLRIRSTPDNGSNYVNSITVDTSGNVGIGTDAPEAPFHILRSSTNIIHERIDATEYAPTSATRKARGSVGALTQCLSGDVPSAFFGQAYDGSSYVGCGNLRWVLEGDAASGAAPTTVEFWNHTSGSGNSSKLELTSAGTLRPTADNAYTLGDASYRWSAVWAANGTIQTSDERDKHIVGELTFAGAMVDAIDPVLFRWEIGSSIVVPSQTETVIDDGGNEVPKLEVWPIPGARQHAGFIAQEIRAAMDIAGVDFGAWGLEDRNDPDSGQWIRPDQLVAVLWAALKETRAEVEALKAKVQ